MPRAVNTLCAVTIWYRWILNITNHKFLYNCIISTCLSCPCWLAPRHLRFISRTWFRLLCRRGGSCFSSVGSMDSAACHNPLRWLRWLDLNALRKIWRFLLSPKKWGLASPATWTWECPYFRAEACEDACEDAPFEQKEMTKMTLGSYVIITCSYLVKSCLTT